MKTISSKDSLILWKHNINGSQIELSVLDGDTLFLKNNYFSVFKSIATTLASSAYRGGSFINVWQRACDEACMSVRMKINSKVPDAKQENVEKVVNKFRGNLGEILVETLAMNGLLEFIKIGTYVPVDPENERFIDAEAVQNGFPIGIQIKNYANKNQVSWETFAKSAAMTTLIAQTDKRINPEFMSSFFSSPRQYIISVTDTPELTIERFKGSVIFLGPSWFEKKKICGSKITDQEAMHSMFNDVAEEIERLTIEEVSNSQKL